MSPTAISFVPCVGCHAEISSDREACPHCNTPIPELGDSSKLRTENARLKALIAEQDKNVAAENRMLQSQLVNNKPGGPVPEGWPKDRTYKSADGHEWKWNDSSKKWE